MLPGQMMPGQMSPWQIEFVLDDHKNLKLKFGHNWVSNSWEITDLDFLVVGGSVNSFSCQIQVELGFWQKVRFFFSATISSGLERSGAVAGNFLESNFGVPLPPLVKMEEMMPVLVDDVIRSRQQRLGALGMVPTCLPRGSRDGPHRPAP